MKPVDKETEVVLRFPDVEKLSPPILMLSAVAFKYEKTGRTIFTNVDLSATMESRICIVRPVKAMEPLPCSQTGDQETLHRALQ